MSDLVCVFTFADSFETLRSSRESENDDDNKVFTSTHAVVFFGTPHRGSELASMARYVERLAGIFVRTNRHLLEELDPRALYAQELRNEFAKMQRQGNFEVYSFQEGRHLWGLAMVKDLLHKEDFVDYMKVVPNHSSGIDDGSGNSSMISDDHRGMCRFPNDTCVGYTRTRELLTKYKRSVKEKKDAIDKAYLECEQHSWFKQGYALTSLRLS